jgi:hypothetical protein
MSAQKPFNRPNNLGSSVKSNSLNGFNSQPNETSSSFQQNSTPILPKNKYLTKIPRDPDFIRGSDRGKRSLSGSSAVPTVVSAMPPAVEQITNSVPISLREEENILKAHIKFEKEREVGEKIKANKSEYYLGSDVNRFNSQPNETLS